MEKYNVFKVISIEYARKKGKKNKPINIIYKPTKHIEIEPLCYFSIKLNELIRVISAIIAINFFVCQINIRVI